MIKFEKFFKSIGIKKCQIVLDFGCGSGNYTIPVAKIVGANGLVYAVDKDKNILNKLKSRAESEGLKNIKIINTGGGTKIKLDDKSVDVVLLYDVFHDYYFYYDERKILLSEIYRISKPNALVSVYPTHMELEKVKGELERIGFHFVGKCVGKFIHHNDIEEGFVLNFRSV